MNTKYFSKKNHVNQAENTPPPFFFFLIRHEKKMDHVLLFGESFLLVQPLQFRFVMSGMNTERNSDVSHHTESSAHPYGS